MISRQDAIRDEDASDAPLAPSAPTLREDESDAAPDGLPSYSDVSVAPSAPVDDGLPSYGDVHRYPSSPSAPVDSGLPSYWDANAAPVVSTDGSGDRQPSHCDSSPSIRPPIASFVAPPSFDHDSSVPSSPPAYTDSCSYDDD